MRIMIVGQKWLATEVLAQCQQVEGVEVLAVYAPGVSDRLAANAFSAGIPVHTGQRLKPENVPAGADLIVGAHTHCYIEEGAIQKARLGAIGYHPSLLPRHRGGDAVYWAVHMGERITGGSVYWMNEVADGGPIAAQDWCHIRSSDTPASLWRRELAPMGVRLLTKVIEDARDGKIIRQHQDETLATWEPKISRKTLRETG